MIGVIKTMYEIPLNEQFLLYFEDGFSTITDYIKQQNIVNVIFVRFSIFENLYISEDLNYINQKNIFWVDLMLPIEFEVERFRNWIYKRNIKISYFFNTSEVGQYYAQKFARLLELEGLSTEQTSTCKNKVLMKEKLLNIGFKVAKYNVIYNENELTKAVENLGLPLVLKPADSSSCRDVYLLKSNIDVKNVVLNTKHIWIIEEFIDLNEYAVDIIVSKNEVLDFFVSKYPTPLLNAINNKINGSISMRFLPDNIKNRIHKVVRKYVYGMQLSKGIVHMEYFADESHETIIIGEVGIRPPGSEMLLSHNLAYGFNIFETILKVFMNQKPLIEYKNDKFIGLLLLPIKKGRIESISSFEEIKGRNGVIEGKINVKIGDTIEPKYTSFDSSGYLLIEGKSEREVLDNMVNILDIFYLNCI